MKHPLLSLQKQLRALSRSHDDHTTFRLFVDHLLLQFRHPAASEEELHKSMLSFNNEDCSTQLSALTEMTLTASKDMEDILGEYYNQHLASKGWGQYFTPQHICDFMACILSPGISPTELPQTMDPACGSRRMLLAAAKINPRLLFFGADVDLNCCKLATFNLLANNLSGDVAHMNSITMQFHRAFIINRVSTVRGTVGYYIETTDPAFSSIAPPLRTSAIEAETPTT